MATTALPSQPPLGGDPNAELGTLNPIPQPRVNPVFDLSQISPKDPNGQVGATELVFHACGDSGGTNQPIQEAIALAMAADFQQAVPSFFLHLGDVIYGPNKDQSYLDRFYRAYASYPAPIVAIPGNHDGEVIPGADPTSLRAFWANFCTATPQPPQGAAQTGLTRMTMTEPGVYWLLRTPAADIFGLYSNTGENAGTLSDGHGDQTQIQFLLQSLQTIASERQTGNRKALIVAMHHPPYSSSGHAGSTLLLSQIDAQCTVAGIYPDLVLSGHSHNYQHYMRSFKFDGAALQVPYLVAGTGGVGLQPVQTPVGSTSVEASGQITYVNAVSSYGYLVVSVTKTAIDVSMRIVSQAGMAAPFEQFSIPL
jgi:predicted phosphodiesterase